MAEKRNKISIITECAILIALGTILAQIKIYRMPTGGSVTAASMVPFLVIGYRHGTKWGLLAGFVNSLLQMLLGGIYPPVAPGALGYIAEILLDYCLAYMVLGFSGLFFGKRKLANVAISSILCCFLRFLCAFISGFLVWSDVFSDGIASITYSLGYNAAYMIPESIITVLVLCTLYKVSPKIFTRQQ